MPVLDNSVYYGRVSYSFRRVSLFEKIGAENEKAKYIHCIRIGRMLKRRR